MSWGDFVFCYVQRGGYPPPVNRQNSILPLFWLLGFWLGCLLGWGSREAFILLLHHNVLVSTSWFELFLLFFTPIFLAFIGLLLRSRVILYSIALVEGVCFGTVLIGLTFCDLSCGWLIATTLLVLKYLLLLPQYLFWSKCLTAYALRSTVRIVLLLVILVAFVITFHQRFSSFVILLLDHL